MISTMNKASKNKLKKKERIKGGFSKRNKQIFCHSILLYQKIQIHIQPVSVYIYMVCLILSCILEFHAICSCSGRVYLEEVGWTSHFCSDTCRGQKAKAAPWTLTRLLPTLICGQILPQKQRGYSLNMKRTKLYCTRGKVMSRIQHQKSGVSQEKKATKQNNLKQNIRLLSK